MQHDRHLIIPTIKFIRASNKLVSYFQFQSLIFFHPYRCLCRKLQNAIYIIIVLIAASALLLIPVRTAELNRIENFEGDIALMFQMRTCCRIAQLKFHGCHRKILAWRMNLFSVRKIRSLCGGFGNDCKPLIQIYLLRYQTFRNMKRRDARKETTK